MRQLSPLSKAFVVLLLLLNLAVLSRFILFKHGLTSLKTLKHHGWHLQPAAQGWKKANLHPFSTIRLMQSDRLDTGYKFNNLAGNIIGFLPLGLLLPLLSREFRNIIITTLLIFLISLCFEYIQLRTGWGVFDVDDLLLNSFGGFVGVLLFHIFFGLRRRKAISETV